MRLFKSFVFFSVITATALLSCEKLAEEDTPVCKDCYKMSYYNSNNLPKDTLQYYRLCGGDVLAWDNFTDSIGDTLTFRYFCK